MSEKKKIELNERELNPRELSYREVEKVMESLATDTALGLLEAQCPDEPIPEIAVALSIGGGIENYENFDKEISPRLDELKDLLPSQVPELFRQVRRKNSFLAERVEALAEIARQIPPEPSTTSENRPAV